MDDKTFVASYVAKESQRINESLKQLLAKDGEPTESEKAGVFGDIESTLSSLQGALEYLTAHMDELQEDEEETSIVE